MRALPGIVLTHLLPCGEFFWLRPHEEIVKVMPPDQTPNYFLVGMQNKTFEKQEPFTV